MKLTRSYTLKVEPNYLKSEDLRYSAYRYKQYFQMFVTQLFYHSWVKFYSTDGMGSLANIAQQEAIGIVKAAKSTNQKDCPQIKYESCPGRIAKSKDSSFDYWVGLTSQWKNMVKIPAKSHKKLNDKLRNGWGLSEYCQFRKAKNGNWYLTPVIALAKKKQADRQRNNHAKKPFKSIIKQLLDKEVNLALRRSKKDSLNLVVENPEILANLKLGNLHGWARCYFANRLSTRAQEMGVYVIWINPRNTSITCSECGKIDKRSRANQSEFSCTGCGNTLNADLNAAFNIALKGQDRLSILTDKAPVKTLTYGGV